MLLSTPHVGPKAAQLYMLRSLFTSHFSAEYIGQPFQMLIQPQGILSTARFGKNMLLRIYRAQNLLATCHDSVR